MGGAPGRGGLGGAEGTHRSIHSDCTWFKVRQRPVFWPSGRVPSTLRARQCPPTTAPSGAASGVPFFPHGLGVSCCCTPEGPPTRREVSSRGTAAREDTVVLSNEAS